MNKKEKCDLTECQRKATHKIEMMYWSHKERMATPEILDVCKYHYNKAHPSRRIK